VRQSVAYISSVGIELLEGVSANGVTTEEDEESRLSHSTRTIWSTVFDQRLEILPHSVGSSSGTAGPVSSPSLSRIHRIGVRQPLLPARLLGASRSASDIHVVDRKARGGTRYRLHGRLGRTRLRTRKGRSIRRWEGLGGTLKSDRMGGGSAAVAPFFFLFHLLAGLATDRLFISIRSTKVPNAEIADLLPPSRISPVTSGASLHVQA